MIKARELRPGNYFRANGMLQRVASVDRLGNITSTDGISYLAKQIIPVNLTTQLINACNFENKEWYDLKPDGNNPGFLLFANDGGNRTFLTTIFSLHELQNIYLDIERKILNVKIK